jgi:FkbM family methyltransferase
LLVLAIYNLRRHFLHVKLLREFIKGRINGALGYLGYRITNTAPLLSQSTFPAMLLRLAARRPCFRTIIDVGASDGQWSRALLAALPDERHLILFEPQQAHHEALEKFAKEFPSARIVRAAAGAEPGDIAFDASSPWGGVAAKEPTDESAAWIRVSMATIDREVKASGFPGPYLIKLDTHGFELPILTGAADVLGQTEVIVVECYNFLVSPTALRFPLFCEHMLGLGFSCIDLYDVSYRPCDNALWQFDLVFARSDSPLFALKSYTPS